MAKLLRQFKIGAKYKVVGKAKQERSLVFHGRANTEDGERLIFRAAKTATKRP
jgi:hypothetical protein